MCSSDLASRRDQDAVNRIRPVIDEHPAVERGHHASGFVHQKIGSRKVPIMAVAAGHCGLDLALRHAHETQRQRIDARDHDETGLLLGHDFERALGSGEARTGEALAGREDWTISAALVIGGRPVAAALFAPATAELFLATAGGGVTRNGAPVHVTNGSLAGTRISGPKRVLERIAAQGAGATGIVVMPRVHSLALRLARVAHGELDAAMAGGNGHDWDLAAADLLVHEAGGMVTALDGQALIYNRPEPVHGMLIAASRERHAALVDLVRTQANEPA